MPGNGQLRALRALVVAVLAVVVLVISVPGAAPAIPTASRNPVLLVHGWTAGGLLPPRPETFAPMVAALKADGHPVYVVDLAGDENVANARAIARAAAAASAEHAGRRVDLVAHSMGGLSARYYLKDLGGSAPVAHYVSMGTGQYGWLPTCALPPGLGGQMCPASPFLRNLNRGDDTPGVVAYTTLRTIADDHGVSTRPDRHLDGGACVKDGIDGGPHADEPSNPTVIALVRQALGGACPGRFVRLPVAG